MYVKYRVEGRSSVQTRHLRRDRVDQRVLFWKRVLPSLLDRGSLCVARCICRAVIHSNPGTPQIQCWSLFASKARPHFSDSWCKTTEYTSRTFAFRSSTDISQCRISINLLHSSSQPTGNLVGRPDGWTRTRMALVTRIQIRWRILLVLRGLCLEDGVALLTGIMAVIGWVSCTRAEILRFTLATPSCTSVSSPVTLVMRPTTYIVGRYQCPRAPKFIHGLRQGQDFPPLPAPRCQAIISVSAQSDKSI